MTPDELGSSMARTIEQVAKAIEAARREAIRDVGAAARREHMAVAGEVPGADRKFSGTSKFNGGRLGVRIRYEYETAELRVSPQGPWGLPAGRGRTKAGFRSWDKGESATARQADRIVPRVIDSRVTRAFEHG